MLLSSTWFPTNLPARAVWFANFNTNFAAVAASLGLTSFVAQVGKDNAVMQFAADSFAQLKAYESAMGQYRRIITEGDIGDPEPAIPANPAFAFPDSVPTGIFERVGKLRDKIMSADAYTDEIGALLGILSSAPASIAPGDVKPSIEASGAQTGYLFSIVVKDRAEADMWDVFIQRKGESGWTSVGRFTGRSTDVTITPATPGDSEQFNVRVQLRKGNTNYGQVSDIVQVTINP